MRINLFGIKINDVTICKHKTCVRKTIIQFRLGYDFRVCVTQPRSGARQTLFAISNCFSSRAAAKGILLVCHCILNALGHLKIIIYK